MTRSYRFPLEKVLEIRLEEEQRQAKIVADARRDAQAARDAVQHLEVLKNASRERIRAAHSSGRAVGQIQNLEWIVGQMDGELDHAETRARDAAETVARCLEEFQRAVKERQSLDRLRDRRRKEWLAESRTRDQKNMDEVALHRFVRAGDRLVAEEREAK